MTRFKLLEVEGWRQFGTVALQFHPRLTILTGANGSGKTTLLNLLSQHFGWSPTFVGTLRPDTEGTLRYFAGIKENSAGDIANIGRIAYDDGGLSELLAPKESASYQIGIQNPRRIPGIYITSHRPIYSYQRVDQIPTQVHTEEELIEQYIANLREYYQPSHYIERSPSHRLKAALISLAVFGYGNQAVAPNREIQLAFEGFSETLERVLPPELDFKGITIRTPEVIIDTGIGEFSLDAASGGIAALVDISWQIFMKSRANPEFCVVIDEPENHLHPSLQRSVLPGLVEAFPQAQFVVATHNPFVVTSVRDSIVVVLDFEEGLVKSTELDDVDRSASANQILTDVLGVPFPVPLWVEDEVEKIANSVRDEVLTSGLLSRLRSQLQEIGLGDLFPDVVDRLLPTDDSAQG